MKEYTPGAGENIKFCASRMTEIADETGENVEAVFNDIRLTATPGQNPQAIFEYFHAELDKKFGASRRLEDGNARISATGPQDEISLLTQIIVMFQALPDKKAKDRILEYVADFLEHPPTSGDRTETDPR